MRPFHFDANVDTLHDANDVRAFRSTEAEETLLSFVLADQGPGIVAVVKNTLECQVVEDQLLDFGFFTVFVVELP